MTHPHRNFDLFECLKSGLERRKLISSLTATMALAGCGMVRKSPFLSTIATFNQEAGGRIDRAKVNSIPYASLLAWFDGNAKALLVLGEYLADDRLVWYSAERQAITTWGPFVLTAVGFEADLRTTTLIGDWNSDPRRLVGKRVSRTLEFLAKSNRATVVAHSRFTDEGLETVQILDEYLILRRIKERVTANGWHNYTNDYWVDDKTGVSWKARQIVIPTMRPLNLAITKAASPQ